MHRPIHRKGDSRVDGQTEESEERETARVRKTNCSIEKNRQRRGVWCRTDILRQSGRETGRAFVLGESGMRVSEKDQIRKRDAGSLAR